MTRRLVAAPLLLSIVVAMGCSGGDGAASPTGPTATGRTPPPTSAPTIADNGSTPTTTPTLPPATTATTTITATTTTTVTTTITTTTTATMPEPRTIDDLIERGTFVALAHAGGDQEAPHSTRFAFEQAVAAGADALEMDVQLTADGVLIVQHDDTVDKTTEATGPVAALTLAEIQALDNAYWFSPECWPCQDRPLDEYVYRGVRTGERPPPAGFDADDFRVPTFREIATAFPHLPLDVEIKGAYPDALPAVDALATELEELDRIGSTVVVSFDDQIVDAFHTRAPDVAVSPGLSRLTAWFLDGAELEPHFRVLQLPPFQGDLRIVDRALVERIHAEGRVVWVWMDAAATQENVDVYAELIGMGVDGIIAGRPAALSTLG
ncbi:MAG: glycerophosphodiester phosphodiesterase [Ilumatobacter sp.]|nr:glycerophosphodiester phosphodiesterase [Ilumatobacter sp.]